MTVGDQKALSMRFFEEICNKGNLGTTNDLLTEDAVHRDRDAEEYRGPEGVREWISRYRRAFPDLRVTIEDQVAEGDRVATRWTTMGTHTGDLMGIPPTGKSFTITGVTIDRVSDGKIVESQESWDTLGMLQQLGAVPERLAGAEGASEAARKQDEEVRTALARHQRAVEAFNAHDPDAVAELYADDGVLHDPQHPEPIRGRPAIRKTYATMFQSIPDIHVTLQNRHVYGTQMIYELHLTGTNQGPILTPSGEIPPTGRCIDLQGAVFADLDASGQFWKTRRYYDVAEMMNQLGLGR